MAIKFDTFKVGSGGAGTDTLDDVTGRGATTTNSITVGGVTVGTEYSLPATDGTTSGQVLTTDALGTLSFTTLDFTGGLEYKGSFNATAGTPDISNAEKGDFYVIDTAGTIYGQTWAVGDHLLINADMGGSITNSKIDKIDNTETTASETVAGVIQIATNAEATAATATNKALVPSNISSVALSSFNNDLSFVQNGDNVSVLTNDAGYLTSVASASETAAGIIEIATNAEATAATATNKALVPSNISSVALSSFNNDLSFVQNGDNVSVLTNDAGYLTSVASASETVAGIIEIATNAEATAATATNKALVPSNISSVALSSFNNDLSFVQNGDNVSVLTNDAGYLTSLGAGASETAAGIIEIATNAEATAATATNKALVPSNISSVALSSFNNDLSFVQNGDNVSVLTNDAGYLTSLGAGASETAAGIIEIATNAEATAATATNKALVPSNISSVALSSFNNDLSFVQNGDNVSVLTNDAGYLTSLGAGASETAAGIIEIATNAEATAATATNKALVPSNISSVALSSFNNDLSFVQNGDNVSVLTNDAGYLTSLGAGASETAAGIIEIATNAEATAATATNKALVPSNISSIALSSFNNDLSFVSSGDNVSVLTNDANYLVNISEDTSPQLGANLDTNQHEIVTASNRNLILRPNGTGKIQLGGNTNPAELRLYCEDNDLHYVGLKAPTHSELSGSQTWRLMTADGTDGQAIVTDGSGNLSFSTISGGGGSAPTVTSASPSSAYTISTTSGIEAIFILTPTTDVSVNLPAASTAGSGYKYQIKNLSTNTITIDPNGSEYIDYSGQTTYEMDVQYQNITLVTDGTNWFII